MALKNDAERQSLEKVSKSICWVEKGKKQGKSLLLAVSPV